jgi:hypothetical protein
MDQQTGKYIIAAGICIVIAGILIYFFMIILNGLESFQEISGLRKKVTGFIFLL